MINLHLIKPNDLWYVVGLIATDGNLSVDQRHMSITSKDTELLEEVKKALHLSCRVSRKARSRSSEKIYGLLQFGDVRFYKFLLKIGLSTRKSLTLKNIKVPAKYFPDFVRGIVDGDGCIRSWIHPSNKHEQWALTIASAAPIFSQWLLERIETYFGVKGKLYSYSNSGRKGLINRIKFGKFASKVILKKIYPPNCLALQRKKNIAMTCLNT